MELAVSRQCVVAKISAFVEFLVDELGEGADREGDQRTTSRAGHGRLAADTSFNPSATMTLPAMRSIQDL